MSDSMPNAIEYHREQAHGKFNYSASFPFKMIQNSMMRSGINFLSTLQVKECVQNSLLCENTSNSTYHIYFYFHINSLCKPIAARLKFSMVFRFCHILPFYHHGEKMEKYQINYCLYNILLCHNLKRFAHAVFGFGLVRFFMSQSIAMVI